MQTSIGVTDQLMARLKSEGVSIVVMVLLLVGLGAGVYLTQNQQTFKSKADVAQDAFLVTDSNNNPLSYVGDNIYKTNVLKVRIRVKDASLLLQ